MLKAVLGARGGEIPPRDSPSRHLDRWGALLALARGRPERLRSRRFDPASKRQPRRAPAHGEAVESRRCAAARHDHRQLRSYGAALAKMGLRIDHRQHKGLNNRAENSHQPTRRRERIMKRFKSARQAQWLVSVHDQIANLFHIPYPESTTAAARRDSRDRGFSVWRQISNTSVMA